MTIMPANQSGWFWHTLAHETSQLGHLYSPRAHRGPWPWFPYALDNGAFSCWDPVANTFDKQKWKALEPAWHELLFWAQANNQKPLWAIVPDVPGNGENTLVRWQIYAPKVVAARIPLALAVQDGITPAMVRNLDIEPDVICVGGSTEWKWETVELWARSFPRVHLLRCNMPDRLAYLEGLGIESTDGTGWARGNPRQTEGLYDFTKARAVLHPAPLWPFVCKAAKDKRQISFA